MSALTAPGSAAAVPLLRTLKALGRKLAGYALRLDRALRNRQAARVLARLDDRMLADIGLTRSDLRDAYAVSPWHDPTDLLRNRAIERRLARRGIFRKSELRGGPAPPLAPEIDAAPVTAARKPVGYCR